MNLYSFTFYLDFDGVIADSAQECIKTSFLAWLSYNQEIREVFSKKDFESFQNHVIKKALNYRYLVTPPEHYYCLIDFIVEEIQSKNKGLTNKIAKKKFLNSLKTVKPTLLENFKKSFFLVRRERLKKEGKSNWFSENRPTKFIDNFLRIIKEKNCELIIISRKDRKSISLWLDEKKMYVSQIFCNESLEKYEGSKYKLIDYLQKQRNYRKGIFIDDSVEEIISENWKRISITPIVAGWGYNLRRDNSDIVLKNIQKKII